MATLTEFLRGHMEHKGWSLREAEQETGVSRTALDNILKNERVVPGLDTLAKLATAFRLPLWRIVEMCGFDMGLPNDADSQAQRLAVLLEAMPQFDAIIDHLAALRPDDVESILVYLEALERRRERKQDQG